MKFITKLILLLIFVPISILAVLSVTARFQLLSSSFWKSDFKTNNVYVKLSDVIKTMAENQTEKGGGKKSDLKVLTDIVTPEIMEDFITRNVDNVLGFANGERKELLIYIPITKIPKEFAPKSVGLSSEEIPLTALLAKFNITTGQDLPLSQIAYLGMTSTYSLVGLVAISLLCLLLIFILTDGGKRLVFPGLAMLISGLVILAMAGLGHAIKTSMLIDWPKGVEPSQLLFGTFAPYILQEILSVWIKIGSIMSIFGVILFFIKKPHDTRQI